MKKLKSIHQVILLLISVLIINDVLAQKNEEEIRIDTTYYKATPYKKSLLLRWNDITDMPIDWYKQTAGMYIVSIHQSGTIYSGKIIKL